MNDLKQKIISNLENTFCRLQKSDLHGVGVFAIRDIKVDTEIFQGIMSQRRCIFDFKDLNFLDDTVKEMIKDFCIVDEQGKVQISEGGLTGMDMSYYLNESDNPNLITIDGGTTFITNRDIKKGEELTCCYAKYYLDN